MPTTAASTPLRAAIAEHQAVHHEQPEELLHQGTEAVGTHLGGVEPGDEGERHDGAAQHQDADQLLRDGPQHRVERQQVPFGHDVGRRHQRIGRDVIVRVADEVGREEHQEGEQDREQPDIEGVLRGVIGVEGHGVLRPLHVDAERVVVARHMQRPDVQADHGGDDEGQQVVQREEAVQRRAADREIAPQPGGDVGADLQTAADLVERGEQVGDDGRGPERHLAPGQHVAHERGHHHQQIDDDAEDPEDLARRLVGTVIEAAEHVDIDGEEEHRGAVGVHIAQEPAVIHVAHDALDAVEGRARSGHCGDIGARIEMHREHDAGDDLHAEAEGEDGAEGVPEIQVTRRREGQHGVVAEPKDRQPRVEPAGEARLRHIGRWTGHLDAPQPTLTRVGERKE